MGLHTSNDLVVYKTSMMEAFTAASVLGLDQIESEDACTRWEDSNSDGFALYASFDPRTRTLWVGGHTAGTSYASKAEEANEILSSMGYQPVDVCATYGVR